MEQYWAVVCQFSIFKISLIDLKILRPWFRRVEVTFDRVPNPEKATALLRGARAKL